MMPLRKHQMRMRRPRREGCLWAALLGILFALTCCGMSAGLYLIFPPEPMTILVMGLDARPGDGNLTRTDSVMLLNINPRKMGVNLLSIPRDLFISVPGYGLQRINAVHVLGEMENAGRGPELLRESIAQNFEVRPGRYVRLNFEAFEALIDAVGGVTIEVDRLIVDHAFPTDDYGTTSIRFEPGLQHFNGEQALIYARTRHSDDDYQRANRQQQVVQALGRKLVNPLYWPRIALALNQHVDTDLNVLELAALAPAFLLNVNNIDRLVIDRSYIRPVEGGAAPNYDLVLPWIRDRFR